jgi:hypothetical protein
MFAVLIATCVCEPLAGSNRSAFVTCVGCSPAFQVMTLPFGNMEAWTATSGQATGASHRPNVATGLMVPQVTRASAQSA